MGDQFKSKYLLTGFMLVSGIIISALMFFVITFIAMLVASFGNIFIGYGIAFTIFLIFFYSLFKFRNAQKFSQMAWYYVLTLVFLGLGVSAILYLIIIAISIIIVTFNSAIALVAEIILYYIIYAEIAALFAAFAISFELRELETRSLPVLYVLTTSTLAVIAFALNGFTLGSASAVATTLVFILIGTFYVLYGIMRGPVGLKFETIEERYNFVIKVMLHVAIAPIHIPWCMYCRIKSIFIK